MSFDASGVTIPMQDYAFFCSSISSSTTSCPSIPLAPRTITFFFLLNKLISQNLTSTSPSLAYFSMLLISSSIFPSWNIYGRFIKSSRSSLAVCTSCSSMLGLVYCQSPVFTSNCMTRAF